jgi:hypothetical protein
MSAATAATAGVGGAQREVQAPWGGCVPGGADAVAGRCNGRVTRMQLRVRRSVVLWRGRGRGHGCWWCWCGGGGGGGGGDAGGGGGGGACVEVVVVEEVEGVLVDFIVELA